MAAAALENLKAKEAEEAALDARITALEKELAATREAYLSAVAAKHAAKRAAAAAIPYKERGDRTYRMIRGTYRFDIVAVAPDGTRHLASHYTRYDVAKWYKAGKLSNALAAVNRKAEAHMVECGAMYEGFSRPWPDSSDMTLSGVSGGCPALHYTLKTWGEWTPMCTLTLDIILMAHPEKGKEGWKLMALTGTATENPMELRDREYRPEDPDDEEEFEYRREDGEFGSVSSDSDSDSD